MGSGEREAEGTWTALVPLDVTTYILGGTLLFYGRGTVLLLVVLFGYLKRVVEFDPATGTVPSFDRWAGLLADGARLLLVWLVYFVALPLVAVLLVERDLLTEGVVGAIVPVVGTVTLAILTGAAEGTLVSDAAGGPLVDTVVVGGTSYSLTSTEPVVVFLVLTYVYPAAVLRLVSEGSVWAAFRFGSLKPLLKSPRYAARWAAFAGLSLLGLFVLVKAGPWGQFASDWVWRSSGNVILLSNEAGELAVFLLSVLSFQLFVLAHYALGRERLPEWGDAVASVVRRHEATLARVVLGGVLLSLGILPSLVLVLGYLSRVVDHARAGRAGLPSFGDWWDLAGRGVRLLAAWVALVTLPWAVLLLGQSRRLLTTKPPADAAAGANAIVGAAALPVGPPVGYQLDRGIGDVLDATGLDPVQDPYGVGDPSGIPPGVLLAFVAALVLAWGAFTLVVVVEAERRREGGSVLTTLRRALGADGHLRRPGNRRRALETAGWWVAGGLPLVGWYVWRRGVDAGQELVTVQLAPLGTAAPIPNPFSLVSILFLFAVSLWNFYALTRAYWCLGASMRPPEGPTRNEETAGTDSPHTPAEGRTE